MRVLEYLVPSRARRELLQKLGAQGTGLSVRQLSLRTGLAYSSVHRELGQMKRAGLLSTVRAGNALLCSWNGAHPAAAALGPLLGSSSAGRRATVPGDETLFWNLRRWGAPLVRPGSPGEKLPPEETLGYALRLARRHPDVARVWPVVFARNRSGLELEVLVSLARRLGEKRTLGFFLALSRKLLREPRLAALEERLRDDRVRRTEDFFLLERGGRARELAERRTPPLARRWHFRMNMPLESFESVFEKHQGRHETVSR